MKHSKLILCLLSLVLILSCVQKEIQPAQQLELSIQRANEAEAKRNFRNQLVNHLKDPGWAKLRFSTKANLFYEKFISANYEGAQVFNEGKTVMFLYRHQDFLGSNWYFIVFESNSSSDMVFQYAPYKDVYTLKITNARILYAIGLNQKPQVSNGHWSFEVENHYTDVFDSAGTTMDMNPMNWIRGVSSNTKNDAIFAFDDEYGAKRFASTLLGAFPNISY